LQIYFVGSALNTKIKGIPNTSNNNGATQERERKDKTQRGRRRRGGIRNIKRETEILKRVKVREREREYYGKQMISPHVLHRQTLSNCETLTLT
jgi:hypothetical protein